MKKIAIISDTHGQLPSSIFNLFMGVDYILHAGDIGNRNILIELGTIVETLAVHGNTDDYGTSAMLLILDKGSVPIIDVLEL